MNAFPSIVLITLPVIPCQRRNNPRAPRAMAAAVAFPIYPINRFYYDPTSAITGGALCAVRWSALFGFFFHAGLCLFEIVRGVCAGCGRGDGSRMEQSASAAPRCRAVRIFFHVLFGCAFTGQLFYLSERQRSPSRRLRRVVVERLVRFGFIIDYKLV